MGSIPASRASFLRRCGPSSNNNTRDFVEQRVKPRLPVRWRGFLARSVEDRQFVTVDNISEDGAGIHCDFGGYRMGEKLTLVMEMPPKPGGAAKATILQATVNIVYVVAEAKTGQFRIGLKIVDMNDLTRSTFLKLLA
ncbi:PilZ domain-containing protein [Aquabacterium sp.]|uniref:PilZ domain-containing protein n=1 Tax=Aquabacterium sp. TaxID=1872578 RepID=UPI002E3125B4|nr:PilZ domain-containing protein [Aquabacterium sp.]HEX5311940.1 PilZ domain-containing protein [Aquabacterium sp.]